MSPEGSDTVLRLAGLVSDGAAVSWASEKVKTPELSGELAGLQAIDQIRIAHAALSETVTEETPIPPGTPSAGPLFNWGKFVVFEWIGEGSFGEVYRAYDPALQKELALKLRKATDPLDDPGAERFLSEARRLARVRHPNVLVIHGVETHDGRAGIWTEFIQGKTLETCLHQQGPWDAREAALAGIDVCRALAAVHAAGIIHRDVKTTNVMREMGGRIVLMDFGSGGELPREGDVRTTRNIHGTPAAMAPEQLRGKVAGPATDVYGLGVLLYRLVTGSFPVEAGTIGELLDRHERRERTPLRERRPDLPTDFVHVVEKALELRPEDRFRFAGEMELALARTLHPQGGGVKWPRVALLLLAAISAVGIGWYVTHKPKPSPPAEIAGERLPLTALTATAGLYRRADSGDERLLLGQRVAPGDQIFMSLQGSDSMFVYVVNEDEAGHVYVLFPVRGVTPENPLGPGVEHRLPDRLRGDRAYWTVTSAGGKETITAIASRKPLPDLEREIDRFPRAEAGRPISYGTVGAELVLRGIGGLSTAPTNVAGAPPGRLSDELRALAEKPRGVDAPWIWQAELENPIPTSPPGERP